MADADNSTAASIKKVDAFRALRLLRFTVPISFLYNLKVFGCGKGCGGCTLKLRVWVSSLKHVMWVQVEKAGGYSSCDGKLVSGLDVEITAHDQRTQICYGSLAEVRRFEEYVYGQSPRYSEVRPPHYHQVTVVTSSRASQIIQG